MSNQEEHHANLAQMVAANEGRGSLGVKVLEPLINMLAMLGIEPTQARFLKVLQEDSKAMKVGVGVNGVVAEITGANAPKAANDESFHPKNKDASTSADTLKKAA